MALKDILTSYIEYNGKTVTAWRGGEAAPLMPFMLLDTQNILFQEYVLPLPLKHASKNMLNQWKQHYARFNKAFFDAFPEEQKEEIVEKMIELYDYAHDDIEIFRISIMNHFMKYDIEIRQVVAAIVCCNHLAQCAQAFWDMTHRKNHLSAQPNTHIEGISVWSMKLLNEYAKGRIERVSKDIDLGDFDDVAMSSKKLIKRIAEFCTTWK